MRTHQLIDEHRLKISISPIQAEAINDALYIGGSRLFPETPELSWSQPGFNILKAS